MSEDFWTALEQRGTWVVGKGGVGKSTTACAIALHAADTDHTVHLISLDPAHSIRDLLNEDCSARLTIEELDARAYADRWVERTRDALIEVVEQGTYLDAEDTRKFLDLSFPGVDEVMATFRLSEMLATTTDRIVIDTAPTGHTLRLIDAWRVLDSWADALDAMIAKADAVAIALVGASPQRRAHALIDEWRRISQAFRTLQQRSDIVVVTRAGHVVEAETERLLQQLRTRGLTRITVIAVGGAANDADWMVPTQDPPPRGCDGLRGWSPEPVPPSTLHLPPTHSEEGGRARVDGVSVDSDLGEIFAQDLLLVAGKGGVGKSTVAGALALLRAQTEATCLISTDPAGSLSEVLEQPIGAEPSEVAAKLRVWQLDADREYTRIRQDYAGEVQRVFEQLGLDRSLALDREVIERLWNLAPPGIDEIVALTELLAAAESCGALVLDSAPTGHFLRLIAMPQIAVDWAHALLRTLMKYHIAGTLEKFSRETLEFARRARALQEDLTEGRAAVVLVTLDEPVVWAETERLHAALVAAKIPIAALVINRADAGPRSGADPDFTRNVRVIRAPQLTTPPVGLASLRDFIERWELQS